MYRVFRSGRISSLIMTENMTEVVRVGFLEKLPETKSIYFGLDVH